MHLANNGRGTRFQWRSATVKHVPPLVAACCVLYCFWPTLIAVAVGLLPFTVLIAIVVGYAVVPAARRKVLPYRLSFVLLLFGIAVLVWFYFAWWRAANLAHDAPWPRPQPYPDGLLMLVEAWLADVDSASLTGEREHDWLMILAGLVTLVAGLLVGVSAGLGRFPGQTVRTQSETGAEFTR